MRSNATHFAERRDTLLSLDPKSFSRSIDLGTLGAFDQAPRSIDYMQSLARLIDPSYTSLVPQERLDDLSALITSFLNVTEQIATFNPTGHGNPDAARNGLQEQLRNIGMGFYQTVAQVIPFTAFDLGRRTELDQLAQNKYDTFNSELSDILVSLKNSEETANRIVDGLRTQVGEATVAKQAVHFETAAKEFGTSARNWLIAAVVSGLMLCLFAYYSLDAALNFEYGGMKAVQGAQLVTAKLLAAAVIAYIASVCVRSFQANRHNQAVNQHRQNALLSFGALVESAGENDRSTVLTHAAVAIFAQQETGFTRGAPQPPEITSNVVNTIPRILGPGA
ncbi:MAG: hypothetical protein K1X35_12230 [Caulobacteraceae bacterium]|nr:hypothetical protein [Caulobacteraceae bacterium]